MINITKGTWKENAVEVIVDKNGNLWLNEKHIEEQLKQANLAAITLKHPS